MVTTDLASCEVWVFRVELYGGDEDGSRVVARGELGCFDFGRFDLGVRDLRDRGSVDGRHPRAEEPELRGGFRVLWMRRGCGTTHAVGGGEARDHGPARGGRGRGALPDRAELFAQGRDAIPGGVPEGARLRGPAAGRALRCSLTGGSVHVRSRTHETPGARPALVSCEEEEGNC